MGTVHRPDFFDLIEGADLGPEEVDDHIARVDQHPVGMGQALHLGAAVSRILQSTQQVIGQRRHMALRPARRDDDRIGQGRGALEIDGDDVFGLVVVELGQDQMGQRFGVGFVMRLEGGRGDIGGQETGFRRETSGSRQS